ncbi:hypothetical protein SAMN05216487_3260 [Pseudomonas sp. UC 17F4]|uniref:hypothetical protein n=1 Tax=Pseudomonas sp. UC 17F4 TaxID=1855328 RepID=UPI00088414D4|nr:hypothetical protein [Pseudomonas sp. UC 17F4]SDQ68394.1 hypothetical protein SAMN05216487_3260 [Pseudomonas sp. UC 17F4]
MQPRFVIVPAVPIATESFHSGGRYYANTLSSGFDVYDNQEKMRLKPSYANKGLAGAACAKMNMESRNPTELFPVLRSE